jgi:hypothetical protein
MVVPTLIGTANDTRLRNIFLNHFSKSSWHLKVYFIIFYEVEP